MKAIILLLGIGIMGPVCFADTYVQGHYRKDGAYVPAHYRSDTNEKTSDNWSTRGNYNPHTGESGTKNEYEPVPVFGGGSREPQGLEKVGRKNH